MFTWHLHGQFLLEANGGTGTPGRREGAVLGENEGGTGPGWASSHCETGWVACPRTGPHPEGAGGLIGAPSEGTLLFGAGTRPSVQLQSAHGVPGRELDDSSCRLSRTPSSYKASFCTIFCRAGLMTICGGCDDAELPRSDPRGRQSNVLASGAVVPRHSSRYTSVSRDFPAPPPPQPSFRPLQGRSARAPRAASRRGSRPQRVQEAGGREQSAFLVPSF